MRHGTGIAAAVFMPRCALLAAPGGAATSIASAGSTSGGTVAQKMRLSTVTGSGNLLNSRLYRCLLQHLFSLVLS